MDRQELLARIDDFAKGLGGAELQRHALQMQKLVRDEVVFTFRLQEWVRALESDSTAGRAG